MTKRSIPVVVRVVGPVVLLRNGSTSTDTNHPHSGRYVTAWSAQGNTQAEDHDRARLAGATLHTTADRCDARVFASTAAAMLEWQEVNRRFPTQPDGLPNRPLTRFAIAPLPAESAP